MVTLPTIHLVNLWSPIPEDDIKSGEAASAAAMRRVTGARSDETRSEFGAEAEQQSTHRDEEGMPRRRDRTQLEVDKEVPTLDNQGTILRIHVKPWTRATAGHASDVKRRWSATFDSKVGAREVSLSGLRDTKKQAREGQQRFQVRIPFNMFVGIGTLQMPGLSRQERQCWLSMVCWCVMLAAIVKTSMNVNPDAERTSKGFNEAWLRAYSPMEVVVTDQGSEFKGVFEQKVEGMSVF